MTGTARFVCSDPDAGDLEFADVAAVLDALEAALLLPRTPVFDAVRQSLQPVGAHPEIRAGWEERLRYRPGSAPGLALPELPTLTALARGLPEDGSEGAAPEAARRREAYARVRRPVPAARDGLGRDGDPPRVAAVAVVGALVLLALVGWIVVTFAARLSRLAAAAAGLGAR